MNEFVDLVAWGLIGGVIAGAVLHPNLNGAIRSRVMRWCLIFGVAAVFLFGIASLMHFNVPMTRGILVMAFIGFPALVSGGLLLVLGLMNRKSLRQ